jgi:hypothetical protein
MSKRKAGFFRSGAATQRKIEVSHDGRRFYQSSQNISREQLYSSSPDLDLDLDMGADDETFGSDEQVDTGLDYDEHDEYRDHEDVVGSDSRLQDLSTTEEPDLAHIKVASSHRIHSVSHPVSQCRLSH